MKKFAFISRHTPTREQIDLAAEQDIELVSIGDLDAFTAMAEEVSKHGVFDGVIVVHPAAALNLIGAYAVGVFENGNRAAEGDRPQFFAKALHIWMVTEAEHPHTTKGIYEMQQALLEVVGLNGYPVSEATIKIRRDHVKVCARADLIGCDLPQLDEFKASK